MPIILGQASGFRPRAKFVGSLQAERVNVSAWSMLGLKKVASCLAAVFVLDQSGEKQVIDGRLP